MSNIKISQLTTATPLTGAELVPIVQGGGTVQSTVSAIAALGTGAAAIVEIQASLSALQVQVNSVSAAVSVQQLEIYSIGTSVSALQTQVNNVSVSVSALQVQVNAVSAAVSVQQVQINAVSASVSTLQLQVNTVSAAVSAVQIQVNAVSAAVSVVQAQVNTVSVAVSSNAAAINLRVLKTGDTMTGALTITSVSPVSAGVSTTGFLADSKGDVRDLQILNRTAAYVVSVGDAGRVIAITSGGVTLNQNVFSADDAFSIYNNSASTQTITQGTSVTMYLVGTATTGNRTLAQRGLATVLCVAPNTFVISGGGLS